MIKKTASKHLRAFPIRKNELKYKHPYKSRSLICDIHFLSYFSYSKQINQWCPSSTIVYKRFIQSSSR